MPDRYSGDVPSANEVDGALALLNEWSAEDAAPQQTPEGVQPPPAYQRPERTRRPDGRFASADKAGLVGDDGRPFTPVEEPQTPPEPLRRRRNIVVPAQAEATPPPPAPSEGQQQAMVDYQAEAERLRQENERLQSTYRNNTIAQREALDAARREAEELRQGQAQARREERESLLAEVRQGVEEMRQRERLTGQVVPQLVPAERELLALERRYFDDERREAEERQRVESERSRQATQQNAELAAKTAAWTTVEIYATDLGQTLNLHPEEVQGVLARFQTDELAAMFQELPAARVVDHVRRSLGPKVEAALRNHQAELLEENRQDLLRSGTHAHVAQPQARPSAPAYERYTRRGADAGQRLGTDAAVAAIMAGMLDDE